VEGGDDPLWQLLRSAASLRAANPRGKITRRCRHSGKRNHLAAESAQPRGSGRSFVGFILVFGRSSPPRLISDLTKGELEPAREYRNLIHPAKVMRERVRCDRGTAFVGAGALEHVLSDLKKNL